jgi:hypothetical protein
VPHETIGYAPPEFEFVFWIEASASMTQTAKSFAVTRPDTGK